MIARIAAAYWAQQDAKAAREYARLMSEGKAMLYRVARPAPGDWEWDVRVAAERKAHTHTKMRKWASRLERKRRPDRPVPPHLRNGGPGDYQAEER